MPDLKLRQAIAANAAMLMYTRNESEYFTAKRKAAKQLGVNFKYHPKDLPSNAEIRERLRALAQVMEGPARQDTLTAMRLEALRWMRKLQRFQPRLIGSVLTGHVRRGSDIDLHLFTDSLEAVTMCLDEERTEYRVERKRVIKHHQTRVFRHIHIAGEFPVELTVYSASEVNYPFLSSITGKPIEKADADGVAALIHNENPDIDLDAEMERASDHTDVYFQFRLLLEPLAEVRQSPTYHPEGDALYHSLQVFCLAFSARPWDSEFVQAALMHDIGKAIDPHDHVAAGVEALEGLATSRTLWLIEHHMEAHAYRDRSLGQRATQRLKTHPDFDDLLLLEQFDREGRRRGVMTPTLDEVLDELQRIDEGNY